jgi:hypothetical protein
VVDVGDDTEISDIFCIEHKGLKIQNASGGQKE